MINVPVEPHVPKLINARFSFLQIVFFMSYCAVMAFVTKYLQEFGFNSQEIGVVVAVGAVIAALAQLLLAHFSDRDERVSPIAVLFFLAIIGTVVSVALAFELPPMLTAVLYTTLIIVVTIGQPFVNALGLSYGKTVNFGLARAFGSISYALTASVLGVVIAKFAPSITNVCTAAMFILLLVTLRMFPKVSIHEEKCESLGLGEDVQGFSFVRKYPVFTVLLVAMTLVQISHMGNNVFIINLVQELGGNSVEMGVATAIAAMVEVPAMILYKPLSKKFSCINIILFATFAFLLKSLITAFSPDVSTMYFACALQMFSFALYLPATVDFANQAMSKHDSVKGQALVMCAQTWATIWSGVIGGAIVHALGVRFAYLSFAGCALIALLIQIPLTIKVRKDERQRKKVDEHIR